MKARHYRELLVWQKSMRLAHAVYAMSSRFPKEEMYGLTAQLRRAVVSIPSNLAEGHNRESLKDYLRFISISQGSAAEVETQTSLAHLPNYITGDEETEILQQADEAGKMLRGVQAKLNDVLLAPST